MLALSVLDQSPVRSGGNDCMPAGRTSWPSSIMRPGRTIAEAPAEVRERLLALAAGCVDELVVVAITHSPKARLRSYELLAELFGLGGHAA